MQTVIDDNIGLKDFYKSFFGIQDVSSTLSVKYNSNIIFKKPGLLALIT